MGLKWRRGRGRGGEKFSLSPPLPSSPSPFSACFQNGGLSDRETSVRFVKNACSAGYVSFQCSRIRTYFHTNNVLCMWLYLPPRSCLNLQENTLQGQAVIPSTTYGKVLLRYLSACRLEFGFSKTDNLRDMFFCRKSSRL